MIPTHQVIQTRLFDASPTRVWEAWTNPTLMAKWFCPLGMTTTAVEANVEEGGTYRIEMKPGAATLQPPPEFGDTLVATGTYLKVDAPKTLAFTWQWIGWGEESRVTITLREESGRTELHLVHDLLANEASRQFHEDGWIPTLSNLVSRFEAAEPYSSDSTSR